MKLLIPLTTLFFSSALLANDQLELSGFGTLGVVSTDSEFYGYRKDVAQRDGAFDSDLDFSSSVIGAQLDYQANSKLAFTYQGVYRDQNDFDFDSASSLAFLKYSPNPNWSFRAGRTAIDLFMIAEYRDIGFAYEWAHAPAEIYGLISNRHLDGVDLTYNAPLYDTNFRFKVSAGQSKSDISNFGSASEIKIKDTYGISVGFDSLTWSFKAQHTTSTLRNDNRGHASLIEGIAQVNTAFWPNAPEFANDISLVNAEVEYSSLGASYRFHDWEILGEIAQTKSESIMISDLIGGYLSVIRKFENHSFHFTAAKTDSDTFDANSLNVTTPMPPLTIEQALAIQALVLGTDYSLNYYASNQTTLSLGWRWNIQENVALKIQLDHTEIEEKGGTLWINPSESTPLELSMPRDSINTVFTNLSFIF